jgi:hypothetical protein
LHWCRIARHRGTYSVDCPPPISSAFGDDPICQPDGHRQLVTSVIGVPVCLVLLAATGFGIRWERRRRQAWRRANVLDAQASDKVS